MVNLYKHLPIPYKIRCLFYRISPSFCHRFLSRRMITIDKIALDIQDHPTSFTYRDVRECLKEDKYGLHKISFQPGDSVIDIGANVGIVSIYLAKQFPELAIFAFEPILENYQNLLANITYNKITNIFPYQLAITKDRRPLQMIMHHASNSGGGTACLQNMHLPGHNYYTVDSITLDDIFVKHHIKKCRLLKIDCEGSEHEILLHTKKLADIEYLGGEFHINKHLESQGYTLKKLITHCSQYFDQDHLSICCVPMADY